MTMIINYIYPPFIFTDDGKRIRIDELKGTPRVGAELTEKLEVLTSLVDADCMNGVCNWGDKK
jgi:hypothetical protein